LASNAAAMKSPANRSLPEHPAVEQIGPWWTSRSIV
jgi:hypothetical protein